MTTSFLCCHLVSVPASHTLFRTFFRLLNCSREKARKNTQSQILMVEMVGFRAKPAGDGAAAAAGKKGKFLMKFATRMRSWHTKVNWLQLESVAEARNVNQIEFTQWVGVECGSGSGARTSKASQRHRRRPVAAFREHASSVWNFVNEIGVRGQCNKS